MQLFVVNYLNYLSVSIKLSSGYLSSEKFVFDLFIYCFAYFFSYSSVDCEIKLFEMLIVIRRDNIYKTDGSFRFFVLFFYFHFFLERCSSTVKHEIMICQI